MYSTQRAVEEHHFTTRDGSSLFYRYWPSTTVDRSAAEQQAVVIFHRGHEHGGRVSHLVDEMNLPDHAFFAWDARGHGRSPGDRGHSPSIGTTIEDIQYFMEHIQSFHGIVLQNTHVVAQSVGAVVAATWVLDYAPPIRSLVLASPALKVKLYVPFARTGLKIMQSIRGNFFVNSYVKAKFLTHDAVRQQSFEDDPLITRPISVNILLALYETAERLVSQARNIRVPTQMLVSGADYVVHRRPQERLYDKLGAAIKEFHLLPGFYHDTLGEKNRAQAITRARRFILECSQISYTAPVLTRQHLIGASCAEGEMLSTPLPPKSWAQRFWNMQRFSLSLGAKLSEGIALGKETGFDSGSTLDYVYRNQATGKGAIGRLIDRQYLDAIGWQGIRKRKENIAHLLQIALNQLRAAQQPIHIVDIAAGHGRYVIETLSKQEQRPESVLLRDYSPLNVEKGRLLIQEFGLSQVAQFMEGNAFDFDSLARLQPAPTLALVSGLYELFPDNALIQTSLAGLTQAAAPGAYLIYTNQPWHPQLEYIARALTSHRAGDAWVMRCRSQAEMDDLVQEQGWRKITQRTDDWGIFTVSLAQKI